MVQGKTQKKLTLTTIAKPLKQKQWKTPGMVIKVKNNKKN